MISVHLSSFSVKYAKPFLKVVSSLLLLAGLLGFIIHPGLANGNGQSGTLTVQDAVQQGKVKVWGEPIGSGGFQQPLITLHILGLVSPAPTIFIPMGTRLIAPQTGFSDLVIADDLEITPTQEIIQPVNAYALTYGEGFPEINSNAKIYLSGPVVDQEIINLLAQKPIQGSQDLSLQLAVWSLGSGLTLDQIVSTQTYKSDPTEIAEAWGLLSPGDRNSENGKDREPSNNGLSLILILLIVFLVLAILFAGGLTLWSNKKKGRNKEVIGSQKSPEEFPKNNGNLQIPPRDGGREEPQFNESQEEKQIPSVESHRIKLVCSRGPLTGQTISLELPCILSRNDVTLQIVSDPSISSPHVLLNLTQDQFWIKDLNSTNGTRVDSRIIGNSFEEFTSQQEISIGMMGFLVTNGKIIITRGMITGQELRLTGLFGILSRENIPIYSFNGIDRRLSDAHALIFVEDGIRIKDLNSTNGTLVNQVKIKVSPQLKSGDKLQLGNSEFVLYV
jgi:hypothetical protein